MASAVELPRSEPAPLTRLARRLVLALALLLFVALLVFVGRAGYVDAADEDVSLLDALYYATVSLTTTGYGDVRPQSETARLLSILFVTPARVLFLILVVGTTVELLAAGTREAYRLRRWRRQLRDHVVICGFGAKGRAVLATLTSRGITPDEVVVIDADPGARREAAAAGAAVIDGDATRSAALRHAEIERARVVVVAPSRDDAAVLITLTARQLAPDATIVAAVREDENAPLLRQSGADSVVVSSGAAGRLLGVAAGTPRIAAVLEDLLTVGKGLDLGQREIRPEEVGPIEALPTREPVVAIVRDGEIVRFDDPRAARLEPGDCLVYLHGLP